MRLITRADFDGLACAAILRDLGIIDNWKFVHPKDLQDGQIEVTDRDVLANVPYAKGCRLWFDHHSSEEERLGAEEIKFEGASYAASSAARIIYDYYGGQEILPHFNDMVTAVDKVDSGVISADEIIEPKGWVLLGFIMDPRTGLGRFSDYRINNYELMGNLIEYCRTMKVEEILAVPDVIERINKYHEQTVKFKEMVLKHSRIDWEVLVTDLREVDEIFVGNRFMIYALYPEQNISVWITGGKGNKNVAIAVGYSILNRTARVDVGSLMLKYGGGGHYRAGTCQVAHSEADRVIGEIIKAIREANSREEMAKDEMSDLLGGIDDLIADLDV
ncbi:MAG: exopolyphosphatase [Turicibacter sp.]|nr:exopolyphosphatase [Turicibacter sp.]